MRYLALISPHFFCYFPVIFSRVTRSLSVWSLSTSSPRLSPNLSPFLYWDWCCFWYKNKVCCRDVLKLLSSSSRFYCFWDGNCWFPDVIARRTRDRELGLLSLAAGEHQDREMKYLGIPMSILTVSTSTHCILPESNVVYSQLRVACTHKRWGIYLLRHDGEALWYTEVMPLLIQFSQTTWGHLLCLWPLFPAHLWNNKSIITNTKKVAL